MVREWQMVAEERLYFLCQLHRWFDVDKSQNWTNVQNEKLRRRVYKLLIFERRREMTLNKEDFIVYKYNKPGESGWKGAKRALRCKVKDKFRKAKEFYELHTEFVLSMVPLAAGILIKVGKYAAKQNTLKKQTTIRECYIYDRSEGHYWELKRPLRTDEWTYVSKEREKGRSYADILWTLGVLK